MGGKNKADKPKRTYRHPKALTGFKEPVRDCLNLAELDRALNKWLKINAPDFVPASHYIDFGY